MNIDEINVGALAYLGDSVYELCVRSYLINKYRLKSNELQKKALLYVSAKAQSKILDDLLNRQILTEEELYTVSRSKNYKPNSKPKYTNIIDYKKATALEALFAYLYLDKKYDRINEIFMLIVGD